MKHTTQDKKRRMAAFKAFLKENPPAMPREFSHNEYKRVVSYARIAFISGFNCGMNYFRKELCE